MTSNNHREKIESITDATLIFPHQLHPKHPAIKKDSKFFFEDPLFFYDQTYKTKFHKQKIVLHRASMKHLASENNSVTYIDYKNAKTKGLFKKLKKEKISLVHIPDPTDCMLKKRIERYTKENKIKINWYENPNFLQHLMSSQNFLKIKNAITKQTFLFGKESALTYSCKTTTPLWNSLSIDMTGS